MAIGDVGSELGKSAPVQAVLVAWLPPVLLGMNVVALGVLPEIRTSGLARQARQAVDLLHVNKYVFLLVIAVSLAAFMSLNRTFFYKILEGDLWPHWLRRWRIERAQVPQYRYVHARQQSSRADAELLRRQDHLNHLRTGVLDATDPEMAAAEAAVQLAEAQRADAEANLVIAARFRKLRGRSAPGPKLFGWLPRRDRPVLAPADWTHPDDADWIPTFPGREDQVMPTRLGNELRAMETYGSNTFGLDTQTFWYELYSLADPPLREAIDDNERTADTFMCSIVVTVGAMLISAAAAIWRSIHGHTSAGLWLLALASAAVLLPLHRGLLGSVREWAATTQALVNNGRLALREKHCLRAPKSISEEREMWTALTGFVAYNGDPHYASRLDEFIDEASRPAPSGTAQA